MTRQAVKFAVVAAFVGLIGNGCGSLGESEDVGTIRVALQAAPADGLCLRLTVDHPSSGLKIVQKLALTPNQPSQMQVGGLPTGSVGLLGEVFNVACGSITATTPLTWVSARVSITITPDVTQMVTLTLRKAGNDHHSAPFRKVDQPLCRWSIRYRLRQRSHFLLRHELIT